MAAHLSVVLPIGPAIADSKTANEWLQQSIDSLLHQTWRDLEIVLVGPAARSGDWPDAAMSQTDSRIIRIRRQEPGIVSALNDGFAFASGDLIARMDADDVACRERLGNQLRFMQSRPDIGLSSTRVEIHTSTGKLNRGNLEYMSWLNSLQEPEQISRNLFIESPCPHPSWLMKRSVWQQLGGYRDCRWAEDYDFLLRAELAGIAMGKPDTRPLLKWREHDNRLTRCSSRYSRQMFIAAKAWALARSHARQRDVVIIGTGRNAKLMFDALKHENVNVKAFVDVQKNVKNRTLRNKPVTNYPAIAKRKHGDALLLSVVTRFGARDQLKSWFNENNFRETTDYIFAG